jgi:hypothetical protein
VDEDIDDDIPPTIHQRFAYALLREALAGAGKVHLDYRVENEPMTIHAWVPRRGANDPEPPPPLDPDPMKALGQGILASALDAGGMVPQTVEIEPEPTFLDFYFVPKKSGVPAPGVLGRMTGSRSILWAYHEPPDAHDAREAMGGALNLWEMHGREAKKKRRKGSPKKRPKLAETWLICAEPSDVVVRGFGLSTKPDWPAGFYFGPRLMATQAVFVPELPETRDTLLLRLLGTGKVLERALEEQAALAHDAPERRAAEAALHAVATAGDPVPIDEATADPALHACRKMYRRWAREGEA